MKLTFEGIKDTAAWQSAGVKLPEYDVQAAAEKAKAHPVWAHFGAGNIFRIFVGGLADTLIAKGEMDRGITCVETFDFDVVDRIYAPYDNLVLAVTLNADATTDKRVLGSLSEAIKAQSGVPEAWSRLKAVFADPSLQMVSFTITEKGYALKNAAGAFFPFVQADIDNGPDKATGAMAIVCAMLLHRFENGRAPLAVVSMDNCSHNGEKLRGAVLTMADEWLKKGFVPQAFVDYISDEAQVAFPWSMIDKITPHPDERIAKALTDDGVEGAQPFVTEKGSVGAIYVNSENPHYLLIENAFPNGHPPLEQCGVIITRRDIVEKSAQMKVATCMNPMDTALGIFGCMLGYTQVSAEMKDKELVNLITRLSENEAMPMVADPGVIDHEAFLHEVLGERYPNPFLQDSPQRTATDTSRKIAPRFGTTLYAYYNSMLPAHRATKLVYIPLVLAGWLRYLVGVDDRGDAFELSPDPNIEHVRSLMGNPKLGDECPEAQLYPLLANRYYFGVNLFEIGVGETVVRMFNELNRGPRAIRETLKKYCGEEKAEEWIFD